MKRLKQYIIPLLLVLAMMLSLPGCTVLTPKGNNQTSKLDAVQILKLDARQTSVKNVVHKRKAQ